MKLSIIYLAIALLFFACQSKDPYTPNWGYEYFPLEVGHWVVYDVDSISYEGGKENKSSYQIKELVESIYTDNEGREAYRIIRYKRKNDSSAWAISDVWTAVRTDKQAEKVEENLRFIKLVFPISESESWKGNAYVKVDPADSEIDYEGWDYEYVEVDVPMTLSGIKFDSTLAVEQFNDTSENIIEPFYAMERYAKGVGMIEKEWRFVEWQPDTNTSGMKIDGGFLIYMTISDFKK